jgi:DNA-binding NarL/FixJ family response regulator
MVGRGRRATDAPDGARSRAFRWRVALVEDHLLQRRRAEDLVGAQSGLDVVWSGETLPDLLTWLETVGDGRRPHLVLLDLMVDRGPSVDPEQVRRVVRSGIRVLVLSAMSSPDLVRKVMRAGVAGVVGKRDPEEDVVAAIWTVLGHGHWTSPELARILAAGSDRPQLSDQEERALVLYASGSTMEAVAEALGVRKDTAKKYLSRVKAKYAAAGRPARTKLDLNHLALQDGYLDPPSRP